jgi:O-6-methylguanine DNA methyltransferase
MAVFDDDALVESLGALRPPPVDVSSRVFVRWSRASSPVGDVLVASTHRGVCFLRTEESVGGNADRFRELVRARTAMPLQWSPRPPRGVVPALRSGRSGGLALDLSALSAFRRAVLEVVRRIPVGETRPYGWVAARAGNPAAARAVAAALVDHPLPLLVPCHRVTRADGAVGDHVLGAATTERLLRIEGANVDETRDLALARVFYLGSDTTGIVCFPTCHNARRITTAHRRGFRSVEEARRAGYRPCRHCRPAVVAS